MTDATALKETKPRACPRSCPSWIVSQWCRIQRVHSKAAKSCLNDANRPRTWHSCFSLPREGPSFHARLRYSCCSSGLLCAETGRTCTTSSSERGRSFPPFRAEAPETRMSHRDRHRGFPDPSKTGLEYVTYGKSFLVQSYGPVRSSNEQIRNQWKFRTNMVETEGLNDVWARQKGPLRQGQGLKTLQCKVTLDRLIGSGKGCPTRNNIAIVCELPFGRPSKARFCGTQNAKCKLKQPL